MQIEKHQIGPVIPRKLKSELSLDGRDEPDLGAHRQGTLNQHRVGGVVLDVENGRGWSISVASGCRHLGWREMLGRRQTDRESRPFARDTRNLDGATHHVHETAADREPDAGSLDLAGLHSQPLKRLEQPRQVLL